MKANKPDRRHLISGGVIAALCCLAPILAVLFSLVGQSVGLGWLGYVLLPALAFFIGLTIYAVWRRKRNTRNS